MAAAIDRPHGAFTQSFEKIVIADLGKFLRFRLRQHGELLRPPNAGTARTAKGRIAGAVETVKL
jgi:hypothetical protein